MKVHITNLYGQSPLSVALMSQNMVTDLAKQLNFKEIGIYHFNADGESYENLAIRFDGMNAAVGNGDVVVFQYPSWNGIHFDGSYIGRLGIYANLKRIIFIHDIPPLMFSSNYYLMERTIEVFNMADALIVPSEAMLQVLRDHGLTVQKVFIQHMWDHTIEAFINRPTFNRVVNFAGNPARFPFVNGWRYPHQLKLYSDAGVSDPELNVAHQGWKFKEELLMSLNQNGGFGLVWVQGEDADYYNKNVSYKLSTYIAAGLPVIVPRTLSNAAIVEQYGLGLVVDSLDEANDRLAQLSEQDYQLMIDKVMAYRELIVNGCFAKKALMDSVFAVLTP